MLRFKLVFKNRYVRVIAFGSSLGLENLAYITGKPFDRLVLPDQIQNVNKGELQKACSILRVKRDVE